MSTTSSPLPPPGRGLRFGRGLRRAGFSLARRLGEQLGSHCRVCGDWQTAPLCTACLAGPGPTHGRCPTCALPLPTAGHTCGACLRQPGGPLQRAVAAFDYAHPWSARILALKYSQDADGAGVLAEHLAGVVLRAYAADGASAPSPPVDLIVPVPLAPDRLRARGHNQAWEVARRLGAHLDIPAVADGVQRWPGTHPQQSLDREARRHNIRGAFHVDDRAAQTGLFRGRRVALVDDVMTTGATLEELALTLQRAGALEIHAWVLARAT